MIDNQYITIISGSPRNDSNTRKVTNTYSRMARERNLQVKVLDLLSLPPDTLFHNQVMGLGNKQLDSWAEEYIEPAGKIVFIFPEYNGSFPGLLKSFVDGLNPELFREKRWPWSVWLPEGPVTCGEWTISKWLCITSGPGCCPSTCPSAGYIP